MEHAGGLLRFLANRGEPVPRFQGTGMATRDLPDADNTSWMLSGKLTGDFSGIPNKPPRELLQQFLPEDTRPCLGLVYVLAGRSGVAKIGKTLNPRTRIKELCKDYRPTAEAELSYTRFYLTHWHSYPATTEKELHQRFTSRRVRLELFRVTPREVLSELRNIRLERNAFWASGEDRAESRKFFDSIMSLSSQQPPRSPTTNSFTALFGNLFSRVVAPPGEAVAVESTLELENDLQISDLQGMVDELLRAPSRELANRLKDGIRKLCDLDD